MSVQASINREKFAFAFSIAYVWVVMILLGAIVFETFIVYPNIFHNVPESLQTSMDFIVVAGPSDFSHLWGCLQSFSELVQWVSAGV